MPQRRTRSGWLVGVLCGVLLGLWAFPPVRYTLGAQLQFALIQDTFPYLRALDVRRGAREIPRLNAVAANAKEDYLLQVGRATALADMSSDESEDEKTSTADLDSDTYNDHTLIRLGMIARDFPAAPGAYAHLIRHMMRERVRITRVELNLPLMTAPVSQPSASIAPNTPIGEPTRLRRSVPARRRDVRLIEWAVRSGQKFDRENAFWPAMLAATYFAAMRDKDALKALELAARKPQWEAYLYEEILGQWRLYSAAYGDYGAAQKIGPLSMLSFPHLRELRYMAEMARWHADKAAKEGRLADAIRIRRNLGWLGGRMLDTAKWAYEALYGTDIFFISSTDSKARFAPSAIRHVQQWQRAAVGYLGLLEGRRWLQERDRLKHQAQVCCDLRDRVDVARIDASYPGIPPGIPLLALFGNWMMGYCLLQQALAFGVTALLLSVPLWFRWRIREAQIGQMGFVLGSIVLMGGLFASLSILFGGMPTARAALVILVVLTVLLVALVQFYYHARREGGSGAISWSHGTTIRMLVLLLVPGLLSLYFAQEFMTPLHPVATLLASLLGAVPNTRPLDAVLIALLTCGLPILSVVCILIWALYRGISPVQGIIVGMRRLALPAIACLLFTYLIALSQTLRYDAAASQAINLAARNDLQWVLTHSVSEEE